MPFAAVVLYGQHKRFPHSCKMKALVCALCGHRLLWDPVEQHQKLCCSAYPYAALGISVLHDLARDIIPEVVLANLVNWPDRKSVV